MEQGYSLGNILKNTTKKQRIGFGLAFVVIVALVVILFVMIGTPQESSDEAGDNGGASEEVAETEQIVLGEGVAGTALAEDGNDEKTASAQVPVSTEYNERHKYTLVDYMPSAIYDFKEYGDGQSGTRIYWEIVENTAIEKGIVVKLDSCDEAGNKALANEYLRSIPVDLSDYVIVYQVRVGGVPCDVP